MVVKRVKREKCRVSLRLRKENKLSRVKSRGFRDDVQQHGRSGKRGQGRKSSGLVCSRAGIRKQYIGLKEEHYTRNNGKRTVMEQSTGNKGRYACRSRGRTRGMKRRTSGRRRIRKNVR